MLLISSCAFLCGDLTPAIFSPMPMPKPAAPPISAPNGPPIWNPIAAPPAVPSAVPVHVPRLLPSSPCCASIGAARQHRGPGHATYTRDLAAGISGLDVVAVFIRAVGRIRRAPLEAAPVRALEVADDSRQATRPVPTCRATARPAEQHRQRIESARPARRPIQRRRARRCTGPISAASSPRSGSIATGGRARRRVIRPADPGSTASRSGAATRAAAEQHCHRVEPDTTGTPRSRGVAARPHRCAHLGRR